MLSNTPEFVYFEGMNLAHSINTKPDTEVSVICHEIRRRRLTAPAIFILEMYKPILGVLREGAIFAAPLLYPLVGGTLYGNLCKLLESPDQIESIIVELEKGVDHGS